MPDPLGATVTLLFTDIEGSTQMLQRLGNEAYSATLARHQQILREVFARHDGHEIDSQGDGFFVVFARTGDAIAAAVEAQRALNAQAWPAGESVRVRVGLHTGEPALAQGRYVGLDVHCAARVMAVGHGGQVLLSQQTHDALKNSWPLVVLPQGVTWRDLGEHRLKDLPDSQRLYQLVIEGLPADFPPLRSINSRTNNLPSQPTPLLGREDEVAAAIAVLRRSDSQLLTLTGAGGTGKTRLGLQVATELLADFPDGVFLVSLAATSDATLLASVVAQVLEIAEAPGRTLLETLQDHLKHKRLLLVLDNFEHIAGAVPDVAALLASCPGLKALVTSRVRLNLRGEREMPVSPLPVPPSPALAPFSVQRTVCAEAVAAYASVQLFVQRAQATNAGFELTNDNAAAVAAICTRLDGLPLAIELAAARVRVVSPSAMLARLEKRLDLLTRGARDMPERHQTLREAIAWSYNLLDETERSFFRGLAVFAGGCSLEAAEAVCQGIFPDTPDDTLDVLASLVEKSLLRAGFCLNEAEGSDSMQANDSGARFCMLETIREYALEQLEESGQAEAARRRHAEFFLSLTALEASHFLSPDAREMLLSRARVRAEHDNLRAALTWSLEHDPEMALRLVYTASGFWDDQPSEARAAVERALEKSEGVSSQVVSSALGVASIYAARQSDFARQGELARWRLELMRESGAPQEIAWALFHLGCAARGGGDFQTADRCFNECLALFRQQQSAQPVGWTLDQLGETARDQNDLTTARRCFEEARAAFTLCGDRDGIASASAQLADVLHHQGDLAGARRLFEQVAAIESELGDTRAHPWRRYQLGRLEITVGHLDQARQLLRA